MRSRGAVGKAMCGSDWLAATRKVGEAPARRPPAVRVENFSRKERRVSGFMVVVERALRIVREETAIRISLLCRGVQRDASAGKPCSYKRKCRSFCPTALFRA